MTTTKTRRATAIAERTIRAAGKLILLNLAALRRLNDTLCTGRTYMHMHVYALIDSCNYTDHPSFPSYHGSIIGRETYCDTESNIHGHTCLLCKQR